MALVPLKHVHVITAKLADGRRVEYHYAWKGKGAPRLKGAPGSPEYIACYHKAYADRKAPVTGTMRELVCAFKGSPEYAKLGSHTTRAYAKYLDMIEAKWGTLPLQALDEPNVRKHFIAWRNSMAAHPRAADYAVGTLKRLLAWGVSEVRIGTNQAEPIGRLHSADKSENIWTAEDFKALAAHASMELMWAIRLAAFTGLRQGDLIRICWSDYDGTSFSMRTSKRGKDVLVPATMECRAFMAEMAEQQASLRAERLRKAAAAGRPEQKVVAIAKRQPILITHRGGTTWTADGLRSSFGKACTDAGVKRTFHDLRRTAATHLVAGGHPSAAVALIMGWEEEAVEALKRKYVSRTAVVESMLARMAENH